MFKTPLLVLPIIPFISIIGIGKQFRHSSIAEWIDKLRYIHIMDFSPIIKRNLLLPPNNMDESDKH